MSKQQVQELNINGVPSSLNLTNIGAYINNGTTNIEIKKYIDDKVKSAGGNGGGGGTVVEGGEYPKLIVLGDTTRTPLEESVEAYNYFINTPSDQWDGRYVVAIGAKETGLCYPYKIKIADSDRIRVYAIKTTDNFPTTYVEYFWNVNGKLTTYATKTYLNETNYKNYISGSTGEGGTSSKMIILNDENFNTVEERKEAFEYIKTLKGDAKYDGRYTFLWKEGNNYTTITSIFAHNDEWEIGDNWVELFFSTYGTWWQVSWRPDNQYEGSYLGELVGSFSAMSDAPKQTYSIHNWGTYDDSTWSAIDYGRNFYEIANPTRFTHMGKVYEKQIPYQENIIPTREDWDNAASDYYTIMNVGRYLFNPTYGLINDFPYVGLVAYQPSEDWRIIKYEYEWSKVKLYRAFVEDNILKIQFAVVNLDDSDDYSWDGMWEIDGWKERWGFTQLEDQEITLEPYRLTMENVNSVYPKENAFYVYK